MFGIKDGDPPLFFFFFKVKKGREKKMSNFFFVLFSVWWEKNVDTLETSSLHHVCQIVVLRFDIHHRCFFCRQLASPLSFCKMRTGIRRRNIPSSSDYSGNVRFILFYFSFSQTCVCGRPLTKKTKKQNQVGLYTTFTITLGYRRAFY